MKKVGDKILAILMILLIVSCDKSEDLLKTYDINGVAQKGPFIIGTNVTITELDSDLSPTGKNYYSTIIDNNGTFQIPDVTFSSRYVKLMADGSYFHEIAGSNVPYRLTLTTIADLNDSNSININVLTHLETDRISHLLNENDMSFSEAKSKTQEEILSIFNFDIENSSNSEYLDILKFGNNNAKLLAISSIAQGYRTIGELTEQLTKIKTDIKEDGILDDLEVKTDLRNRAEFLRLNNIKRNLMNQFKLDSLSDFQKYINYFLDNSEIESDVYLGIPVMTDFGLNLLKLPDNSILNKDSLYCLASNIICEDLLLFNVHFEKDSTLIWNYADIADQKINGWFYGVEENQMDCNLVEQNSLSILPFQFNGSGELKLTINIDAGEAGGTHAIKEFIIE